MAKSSKKEINKALPSLEMETPDPSRVSRPLTRIMKIALADIVVSFADLEAAIETAIWSYIGLDARHGRLLTGMDVRRKIDVVKTLLGESMTPEKFKDVSGGMWPRLEALRDDRNTLVHSTLFMLDRSRLLAVSFRGKGDDFTGLVFTIDRLRMLAQAAEFFAKMFRDFAAVYERRRATSMQPPPER